MPVGLIVPDSVGVDVHDVVADMLLVCDWLPVPEPLRVALKLWVALDVTDCELEEDTLADALPDEVCV